MFLIVDTKTAKPTTYVLQADTVEEKQAWVIILQRTIARFTSKDSLRRDSWVRTSSVSAASPSATTPA